VRARQPPDGRSSSSPDDSPARRRRSRWQSNPAPFLVAIVFSLAALGLGTWGVASAGVQTFVALVVVVAPVLLGARKGLPGVPRTLAIANLWPLALGLLFWLLPAGAPGGQDLGASSSTVAPRAAANAANPPDPSSPPPVAPPTSSPRTSTAQPIPFRLDGESVILNVRFRAANGTPVEVPMLFDTGASHTTLNDATFRELGYEFRADAPEFEYQTAHGVRRDQVALVDGIEVGGTWTGPVTINRCEDCSNDDVRGLLGINLTGRFLIGLDLDAQVVTLEPRGRSGAAARDVGLWVEVTANGTRNAETGVLTVHLAATNRSDRNMRDVDIEVSCGSVKQVGRVAQLPGRGTGTATVALQVGTDDGSFRYEVKGGAWEQTL
jgi:hypothetical protein